MKPFCILFLAMFLLVFVSCRKETFEETPSVNLMSFNDTCTYTINGTLYTCSNDNIARTEWSTSTANNNPQTGIGDPDSVMFRAAFFLRTAEGGVFKINFLKKYAKNQFADGAFLPNTPITTSLFSRNRIYDTLGFFNLGERKYNLDYDKLTFNQDGVTIEKGNYASYPNVFSQLNGDIQNNSYFEILKYYSLPTGGRALEAKFTVNLFNYSTGQQQRIENGYLLIHVY